MTRIPGPVIPGFSRQPALERGLRISMVCSPGRNRIFSLLTQGGPARIRFPGKVMMGQGRRYPFIACYTEAHRAS